MNILHGKSLTTIKKDLINEKGSCEICGYDFKSILQIHHIKPVSLGGTNKKSNLIILCPNCHKIIHAIDSHYSDLNFGVDYIDDWMDENMHPSYKEVYLHFALKILNARYPNAVTN